MFENELSKSWLDDDPTGAVLLDSPYTLERHPIPSLRSLLGTRHPIAVERILSGTTHCVVITCDEKITTDWDEHGLLPLRLKIVYERMVGSHVDKGTIAGKIGLVTPSASGDCDVNLTFWQMDNSGNLVRKATCGHLAGAVAEAAAQHGLSPRGTVRIKSVNTNRRLLAKGVGKGRWKLNFSELIPDDPLPTGSTLDRIQVGERDYEATLLTAGNPYIIIGESNIPFSTLEELRSKAASSLGCELHDHIPKVAQVGPPKNQASMLFARIYHLAFQFHPAVPLTGVVALLTAASIEGTIVRQLIPRLPDDGRFRIDHPSGTKEALLVSESGKVRELWLEVSTRTLTTVQL